MTSPSTLVASPTAAQIAAVVGRSGDEPFTSGECTTALQTALNLAFAYTRGVGFSVASDENGQPEYLIPFSLYSVVLQRAVRIVTNYEQLTFQASDNVQTNYGNAGQGWTTQEIVLLNAYRKTSA